LTAKLRREEAIHEPRKRANVARFLQQGLKFAFGQQDAAESGKSHRGEREGSGADYPDL
jgi:hypothetical protein